MFQAQPFAANRDKLRRTSGKSIWSCMAELFCDASIVACQPQRRVIAATAEIGANPGKPIANHWEDSRCHQVNGRMAVNWQMNAATQLRIPAITVASGPMAVKIRNDAPLLTAYPGPQRRRKVNRIHRVDTAPARCHE
jgi:hypothetical protein